ncbi:MAG: triphosphoribosyl-dephospho-CoA synthase [Planctomycetota bacterium]
MTLAEQIELACLLEATARKAGNVHPAAAFDDLDYADFVDAAQAVAEPLSQTREIGLGRAILSAMQTTRAARVRTNANLGIVLLLAPLAAVPDGISLNEGLRDVLSHTTVEDAECVYEAIRLSRPNGLGRTESQDVNTTPTVTLRDAMALAAGRDRIAEQYATDFAFVLNTALPWLCHDWPWLGLCPLAIFGRTGMRNEVPIAPWESAIIKLQLRLMADAPDSLIVRKCGEKIGEQVRRRAAEMMDLDWPQRLQSWSRFDELDLWLRADGHRRNPGTTADLIAATLFAVMRAGLIEFPSRERILQHAEQLLFSPSKVRQP